MSRLHSIMYKIPMNDNPNSQWMLDLSANDSSRTKWRKKKAWFRNECNNIHQFNFHSSLKTITTKTITGSWYIKHWWIGALKCKFQLFIAICLYKVSYSIMSLLTAFNYTFQHGQILYVPNSAFTEAYQMILLMTNIK